MKKTTTKPRKKQENEVYQTSTLWDQSNFVWADDDAQHEHKADSPKAGSYQYQCRLELSRLNAVVAESVHFNQILNAMDRLSWKADKQVQSLKDKIQWLQELNNAYQAGVEI